MPCVGEADAEVRAAERSFQSFADSYHVWPAGRAASRWRTAQAAMASMTSSPLQTPRRASAKRIYQDVRHVPPGANENFAEGQVHVIATQAGGEDDILYFVSSGYIVLIVVSSGG